MQSTYRRRAVKLGRVIHQYQVHEILGRGGMACVYRATDLNTGRQVALKQLLDSERAEPSVSAAWFEREFHTLAQLSHPCVIDVYDYGVEPNVGPYYTMELLEGGDLYECAPLTWRAACRLMFDVCSSLALLHSRRLLHRDVSPRNIRRTHEGRAKLTDFGAMAPMGPSDGTQLVGTPSFIAPERLHRLALDARADLFSLGVTFYYALTRVLPYPVRDFSELHRAWTVKPVPPSAYAPEVPEGVDDLVLALISTEPGLRPRSAFEVMQRLATLSNIALTESEAVSQAYLSTPSLVGREPQLCCLRDRLKRTFGGSGAAVLLQSASGMGRSRVVDTCVLEAKTHGALVLHTHGLSQEPLSVIGALMQQLLDTFPVHDVEHLYPELFESTTTHSKVAARMTVSITRPRTRSWTRDDLPLVARGLLRLSQNVSQQQPLVIAIDDVHRIDRESAVLLAQLIDDNALHACFFVLAADTADTVWNEPQTREVLQSRCEQLPLPPLSTSDTKHLLGSIFGDAANLNRLAFEVHEIARGNPAQSIAIAQSLVDQNVIKYSAGSWVIPSHLESVNLPRTAHEQVADILSRLSPNARALAEAQSLAFSKSLTIDNYCDLAPAPDHESVERAVAELLSAQAIVDDGHGYVLSNRIWVDLLHSALHDEQRRAHHSRLANMYRAGAKVALLHHLFEAERYAEGIATLLAWFRQLAPGFDHRTLIAQEVGRLAKHGLKVIEVAQRQGYSVRDVSDLLRWFVGMSVVSDASATDYWRIAPEWLAQLSHDSGLETKLPRQSTEHGYTPEEAPRQLAIYSIYSAVIGMRSLDLPLLHSLPEKLAPFLKRSPLIEPAFHNAMACVETLSLGAYEAARARFITAHKQFEERSASNLPHALAIANAVRFGIGLTEAYLGLASAATWADDIEDDPIQQVGALQLRKIARLSMGDVTAADKLRRDAELLALRAQIPQMSQALLPIELIAYVRMHDLSGIVQVTEQIKHHAERYASWAPYVPYAEGWFQRIRGDYTSAKQAFGRSLEQCPVRADGTPLNMPLWIAVQAALAELALETADPQAAASIAQAALSLCELRGLHHASSELVRIRSLADAKLGCADRAITRLDALIEAQIELGVTGLALGLTYEACAQIAAWEADEAQFEHYAHLTAKEYRYPHGSALGIRYERLIMDASRRLHHSPLLRRLSEQGVSPERPINDGHVHSTVVYRRAARPHGKPG